MVGIDYDCRERKVYWTDLAGRMISRAALEPGSEPEILINTGNAELEFCVLTCCAVSCMKTERRTVVNG